jgi:hypothetical protein
LKIQEAKMNLVVDPDSEFNGFQAKMWQSQKYMKNRNAYIVLNFTNHPPKKGMYPEHYIFINLPMTVNVNADNADVKVAEYITRKLEEYDIDHLNFIPIVILPNYSPLIVPIVYIITQLFGSKLPIITSYTNIDDDEGYCVPKYLIPGAIKSRIRPYRPEHIKHDGLVIL